MIKWLFSLSRLKRVGEGNTMIFFPMLFDGDGMGKKGWQDRMMV